MTLTLRPQQLDTTAAMEKHDKGQCILPTGAGKTLCMITDCKNQLDSTQCGKTIVVVAPRLLLADQLCKEFMEVIDPNNSDPYLHILHVHSGDVEYTSTTKAEKIHLYANCARTMGENVIIFTTYHSLHRVMEADIEVNTIYFDEAHNSVQRNFFPATEFFSTDADRCYFFTATPKHSLTVFKPGMNDPEVYGQVICNVPAPKLVEQGYILPPKVVVKNLPTGDAKLTDCDNLLHTIDEQPLDKILIAARSTKQIMRLVTQSNFCEEIESRGYSWMHITSKHGAIIDGVKVNRECFFETLNKWGQDPDKKFIVMHHSILSEGMNVKGLEAVFFMRNMDYIGISQSIGRVIRTGGENKTFGLVCIPVYDKVGISTSRRVQAVVDTVFQKGEPAITEVRR